jgi:hypothetical protein
LGEAKRHESVGGRIRRCSIHAKAIVRQSLLVLRSAFVAKRSRRPVTADDRCPSIAITPRSEAR